MLRRSFDTFSVVCVTALLSFIILELAARYYLFNHTNKNDFRRYASLQQLEESGQLKPRFSRIFMPGVWEHSTLLRILFLQTGLTTPHATVDQLVSKFNQHTFYGKQFPQQQEPSQAYYLDGHHVNEAGARLKAKLYC